MIKEFNTYIDGIDYDLWRSLFLEHGILKQLRKGENFITIGEVAKYFGFIKEGSIKYVVYASDGSERVIGLESIGGFAASFPYCLQNRPAVCSVIANSDSELYCIPVIKIKELMKNDISVKQNIYNSILAVFYNIYDRYIDLHALSPKERYNHLLERCPQLFNIFQLKDIASYLNITPTHLSRLKNS